MKFLAKTGLILIEFRRLRLFSGVMSGWSGYVIMQTDLILFIYFAPLISNLSYQGGEIRSNFASWAILFESSKRKSKNVLKVSKCFSQQMFGTVTTLMNQSHALIP